MDPFSKFIHVSRYARWLPDKGRREVWDETVFRYWNWMVSKFPALEERSDIRVAIFNMDIMPSMRLLMTAGAAADRDHTCAFNCSYLPILDIKAFSELMYILMCGTGVGFSVEEEVIKYLPVVPDSIIRDEKITVVVEDSKEGWCLALRSLLSCLYNGTHPTWDTSHVRPAGSILETFGGRASGPGPLEEVFKFVTETMYKARGRRLTALECHDICCAIAQSVIVGGVRRSAMISLSDLHDREMATCKSGAWWDTAGHRSLANNSAVYNGRPSFTQFLEEWENLYLSRSGERGIFNREATQREEGVRYGTNPCGEIILRPFQFCNLTEAVLRPHDNLDSIMRKIEQATILGTCQAALTNFPFLREEFTKNTEEERLLGVSLTGIYDNLNMSSPGPGLELALKTMRSWAHAVNERWAEKLGIPKSAAVTCVKPSGTVSCLADTSSGIHPRFSDYYIRRVRLDKKDPLYPVMKDQIPCEDCVNNPDTVAVFSFVMKSPTKVRDISPMDHLELWYHYKKYWCDHNPSVTITYEDKDFLEIGSWVYNNFNDITGISFLPKVDHVYAQAPFERITLGQYLDYALMQPGGLDLSELVENGDNTTSSQTLACTGGSCEIVDIIDAK